ncbi:uncharacterized protein N7469_006536, partial [Penicillium citrinum]
FRTAGWARRLIPSEQPIDEDVFHTETDSHAEDISDAKDDFLVSITYSYSTITARARSFQGIVLTGVTPFLLAQNGFYYQPSGVNDLACCFACQSTNHLSTFQHNHFEEVQQLHEEDCIWQIISCDLEYHLGTPKKPSPQPPRSPIRSRTQSTPNISTRANEQLNTNLDCCSNLLSKTIDQAPQQL